MIFILVVPDARPFVIVSENEFASFYRDNQLLKTEQNEGLYWKIPFSTKVRKYSLESSNTDIDIRYIMVKDNIYLNLTLSVYYGIGSPDRFLGFSKTGSPDPLVILTDSVPSVFKTGLSYLYFAEGDYLYDKLNALCDPDIKKTLIDAVNENIGHTGYEIRQFFIKNIEYTPVSREFINSLLPE